MGNLISKADLRSVIALIMIGMLVGSWVYFLTVVPIDASKAIDGNLMVSNMMQILIGTLIGVFAWLGFRQGQQTQTNPN